jgi:hypothetical protein
MLNLDEPSPTLIPHLDVTFRRVNLDDVPALVSATSYTAEEIHNRFETGRQCYAAWIENQIAAYGWVSFEREDIGELNLRIKLLAGEAYIWDCATLSPFRGKYLYSALLIYILSELRDQGLCRAWIGADADNIPSQKGMMRAGFHHVADLVIERVLATRQVWVMGRSRVPESIVAEARRAFLNDRDKVWLTFPSSAMKT